MRLTAADSLSFQLEGSRRNPNPAGFTVTDLAAEVAALQSAQVQVEEYDSPTFKTINGIAESEILKSTFFQDIEDNRLGMVEFKSVGT